VEVPVIQWKENPVVKWSVKTKKAIKNKQEDMVKMDSLKQIQTGTMSMMAWVNLILMTGDDLPGVGNPLMNIVGQEDLRFQETQEFQSSSSKGIMR